MFFTQKFDKILMNKIKAIILFFEGKYMGEIRQKDMIIKIIAMLIPEARIYLFGSYARQQPKIGSDIDIAVDASRRLTLAELKNAIRLIGALPIAQRVDVVDFHRVPEGMRKSILAEGILWKK